LIARDAVAETFKLAVEATRKTFESIGKCAEDKIGITKIEIQKNMEKVEATFE